jgi:protein-disulfide isomerase
MADGRMVIMTALKSGKGVMLTGIVALCLVSLLNIGARKGAPAADIVTGTTPALAQEAAKAAPATDKSGTFTPDQVKALHVIIKDYLVANPEVLAEVSAALEKKQAAEQAAKAEKYLLENKPQVFASAGDFVLGNPKGDVTVVEFFDYNCGWCKRAVDDILNLTKSDSRVRVVMKEYPIFGGPPSVVAAKAAMASIKQNKYWEFHTALMREKQVTEQNVFTVAQRVGLDVARLKADMADKKLDAIIEQNIQVGQGLGIEGTPGFVIDSRVNVGYVPSSGMKQMIADIRKQGCKVC